MNKAVNKYLVRILFSLVLGIVAYIVFEVFDVPFLPKLITWILIYIISGLEVLKDAFLNLIHGQLLDEKFLMSIASIGAFAIGLYVEGAGVMVFYALGEMVQDNAVSKSRSRIKSLAKMRVDTARVLKNGRFEVIDPRKIEINDILEVKPGEKIPVDGIVVSGISNINASSVTGESIPVTVSQNDEVFGGTLNEDGVIRIKATKIFSESTSEKIIALVEDSTLSKSKTEKFITKFANVYTPIVVGLSVVIALVPSLITGNYAEWIRRALMFLVVSCPCALVISVPMAFFAGVGNCSKKGLLVKGCDYLERMATVSSVVLDKTGTVTMGDFEVSGAHVAEGFTYEELISVTLSGEKNSNHPIALSLVKFCEQEHADFREVQKLEEIPGLGISFDIDDDKFSIGNRWKIETELKGSIVVTKNNKVLGTFEIIDKIKPDSKDAIDKLKLLGVKEVSILSGDNTENVENCAKACDADKFYAELKPQDKVSKLKSIIEDSNGTVIYAGDGINDAPVLALADVGIAMGGIGQDAAVEASDAVAMNDSVMAIANGIDVAKKTVIIARENIILALFVKFAVLVLSVLGLSNMFLAVFADVGVCLLAVLNSMRIVGYKKGK